MEVESETIGVVEAVRKLFDVAVAPAREMFDVAVAPAKEDELPVGRGAE